MGNLSRENSSNRNLWWLFSILVVAGAVAAWIFIFRSPYPSETDARHVFENINPSIKSGVAVIKDFKKTNSQTQEGFGIKVHEIEFEAKIEFLGDYDPMHVDSEGNNSLEVLGGIFSAFSLAMSENLVKEAHKAGEIITFNGKVSFEESEKGWKGQDGAIY